VELFNKIAETKTWVVATAPPFRQVTSKAYVPFELPAGVMSPIISTVGAIW
jgi:hypothetical protein